MVLNKILNGLEALQTIQYLKHFRMSTISLGQAVLASTCTLLR